MPVTRRAFVMRTAAAGAAVSVPMLAGSRLFGANEEIRVGVVGVGGRGLGAHVPGMQNQKGVRIVAIADPDAKRLGAAVAAIDRNYHIKVDQYCDMRKLFERKDIDVVSNATQNYWHGLSTIWACEAGKHVYVEKPLSHYIWEGRQMVHAARKYGRIVQCGTQHRSNGSFRAAAKWIREGQLGKINCVTAFANKGRSSCGKLVEPLGIPASVDFDLWCGPARKVPIYRKNLQYDCSFDWNTGDGESCNQGVHEVDVARLVLGDVAELPRRVISIGGRFVVNDACDVPNTQIIYYDFPEAPLLYELHNLTTGKDSRQMPDFRGRRVGVAVDCEGGWVDVYGAAAFDKQGKKITTFRGPGEDHFGNFIHAVRAGKREVLNAEVLVGQLSTRICHAGNISLRVGARASVAEARRRIGDLPRFAELYDRFLEHLKAHAVDPNSAILGQWLECDSANECFKNDAKANELVRGFYRAPYVISDLSSLNEAQTS